MKPYYQDDAVTIYHGDCRDVADELAPKSVDLVLTDPPYGMAFVSGMRTATEQFTIPRWFEGQHGDEDDVRHAIRQSLEELGFGIRDLSVDVWRVPDEEVAA